VQQRKESHQADVTHAQWLGEEHTVTGQTADERDHILTDRARSPLVLASTSQWEMRAITQHDAVSLGCETASTMLASKRKEAAQSTNPLYILASLG